MLLLQKLKKEKYCRRCLYISAETLTTNERYNRWFSKKTQKMLWINIIIVEVWFWFMYYNFIKLNNCKSNWYGFWFSFCSATFCRKIKFHVVVYVSYFFFYCFVLLVLKCVVFVIGWWNSLFFNLVMFWFT